MKRLSLLILGALLAGLLVGCATDGSSVESPAIVWLQQHATAFASIDPENESFDDLQAFGNAIGEARIVALGEPSHGGGETFKLKTRLVKYLHQKKGFDVLMLESGLFDVSRVGQLMQGGQAADDLAPDVIFYMYSKSAEARTVLQYVDSQRLQARPLRLVGMDSNHTGLRSKNELIPMLETYLQKRAADVTHGSDWPVYQALTQQLISMNRNQPVESEQATFYRASGDLETDLCAPQPDMYTFPNSPGWWCRVVKSLHNQADRYWKNVNNRDVDMALNAQWLLEHPLKGRKVVVWAHTAHVSRVDPWIQPTMGAELARVFGDALYVVSMTASTGTFTNYGDMKTNDVERDEIGSVEWALSQTGKPLLFVDARHANPPVAELAQLHAKEGDYSYQYNPTRKTRLGSGYDGLFYIKAAAPVTMNR